MNPLPIFFVITCFSSTNNNVVISNNIVLTSLHFLNKKDAKLCNHCFNYFSIDMYCKVKWHKIVSIWSDQISNLLDTCLLSLILLKLYN